MLRSILVDDTCNGSKWILKDRDSRETYTYSANIPQIFDSSRESIVAIASEVRNEIIGQSGCFSHRLAFIRNIGP